MNTKRNLTIITLAVFIMGLGLPSLSMAVSASAECAYTADDLVCYIYVDTLDGSVPDEELRSGGLKLTYNSGELMGPGALTPPNATKNVAEWYFGAGSQDPNLEYMDPETATDGEVVFIVGKLDTTTGNEDDGVIGERVLIGTVTFTRINPGLPVADPATTFNISLALGRTGSYVNFVNVGGDELDTGITAFTTTLAQRGDANADGSINSTDFGALRSIFFGGMGYVVYADCNGDGGVNSTDFGCLRNKFFGF